MIYGIECNNCNKIYIGQTRNDSQVTINQYKENLTSKQGIPLTIMEHLKKNAKHSTLKSLIYWLLIRMNENVTLKKHCLLKNFRGFSES